MDAVLVEFAQVLRQNGVRVSPAELQDAMGAMAEIGLDERPLVRAALETTLVKRERTSLHSARPSTSSFPGGWIFAALDISLARRIEEEGYLKGDELKRLLATLPELLAGLSPLAQAALGGTGSRLAQLFRSAALRLDFSHLRGAEDVPFFGRRLFLDVGGQGLRTDLQAIQNELTARGFAAEGIQNTSHALSRGPPGSGRGGPPRGASPGSDPAPPGPGETKSDVLFRSSPPQEMQRAQVAVRRLAERLKSRLLRRHRNPRRGALHVRKTLRRNLPWGGIPMVPVFRDRRPERPDVVVLCDISDSVRNVSRLMLAFMHTLQLLVVRVRSFVFVSELGEVTSLFKGKELDAAIEAAVNGQVVPRSGNSNYGQAFGQFARRELASIGRRTTVVVIGDGRSNYNPSGERVLDELRKRCQRLL